MPAHFLLDENLPRSLAPRLRAVGLKASDVRDEGLRGRPDTEILAYAISNSFVLVTGDLGFGGLVRPGTTLPALILVRLPDEWPSAVVNDLLERVLSRLDQEDITGFLIVIEPDRIRRRRLH